MKFFAKAFLIYFMNISYNWLKDLIEINLSPADLAAKLTKVGLAVEGIHEFEDDFVFDIDLTSNRPDCLSHLGVSREIAAITQSKVQSPNSKVQSPKSKVQSPKSKVEESKDKTENSVTIQDPELCHRFTARIIRSVKIAPSPEWLVKRLEAIGERSINNVADITNFVMHELGNPMHAFDLNKLAEKRIVVRRAENGEKITTLDEVGRRLNDSMLAICDAEKPAAVAGVMGGLESSITEETTEVLIEVAYFKPENIRQASRELNLSTEASYRFERGVDIENLIRASNRATELICELAGGEAGELIDVYPEKFKANEIESKNLAAAVKRLTGLRVEDEKIFQILTGLGIEKKSEIIYIAPSWRHDLTIEEDLVEEIARIVGYDKIADELPPTSSAGEYQPNEIRKFHLRQTLANLGFDEAISYSFIDTKNDERFEPIPNLVEENLDEKFVSLRDSIIEGATRMRPNLLAGLLDAVRTNFNHQQKNLRLFEIGKVFSAANGENALPNERELLAIVLTGGETFQNKAMTIREFDFYDAKGSLESALGAVKIDALEFAASEIKHLRKGQSAAIYFNGKKIGSIGRLADETAQNYKFKQPVYVAEIDLQTVLAAEQTTVLYRPLPIYPAIQRDVSLLVKRSVAFSDVKKQISQENYELLKKVDFVDVYEGKGMADDERSLTVRLEYRSDQKTLLDEEVEQIHRMILQSLEENLGAKLRS